MTNTISGSIGTGLLDGMEGQLWLLAPAGLAIAGLIWGFPKAVSFVKRIAK